MINFLFLFKSDDQGVSNKTNANILVSKLIEPLQYEKYDHSSIFQRFTNFCGTGYSSTITESQNTVVHNKVHGGCFLKQLLIDTKGTHDSEIEVYEKLNVP